MAIGSSEDASGVAEQRTSLIRVCVVILTVCAVGAVATYLRTVLTPFLLGLLLFFLVLPGVQYLDAYRVPRWMTYVLLGAVATVIAYGMWQLIAVQGQELSARVPQYRRKLQEAYERYVPTFGRRAEKPGPVKEDKPKVEEAVPVTQDDFVKYLFGTTLEVVELCTMAIFYLLFALMECRLLGKRLRRSYCPETANRIESVLDAIKTDMRSYLWIKTLVSAGLGLSTAALAWLFGLDFWLMWGCLMFLSNYITYIGSIVVLLPMALVAFAQFNSPGAALGLTALLTLNRLVWIDYAEMRYSGKYVDVSPVLVLFSVALLGSMWGVAGMLLAVPLITTCRIVLDSVPETRYMARLISDLDA